jgi:predicted acyl esterase
MTSLRPTAATSSFRVLPWIAGLLLLPIVAGCGDSGGGGGPSDPTVPASYAAHGSVGQVWITDAEPGQELRLTDEARSVVQTGTADAQGTLIFRDVPVASGYTVRATVGSDTAASEPLAVTGPTDAPEQSFYDQQTVVDGYQYVTTRDGTLLSINVKLPGPIENGPYPTVIEYSGYSPADPDSPQPSELLASSLGYATVGVNMRGTGCSGGAFQFFETLQSTDGYDVVEIIAAQPWALNHKVGMVGLSYPGISQLFVAQLQPPSLVSIAPLSVIADTARGVLYPGGILNNGFATDWAAERKHDAQPGGQGWSQRRIDAGDQTCIDNQRLRSQSPDILKTIDENQFYTAAIADPISPTTFVDKINVPVFLTGAWQDEQTGPYFATMLDRFTSSPSVHFTMTNGAHTEGLTPAMFTRWMEFLDLYVGHRVPRRSPLAPVILSVLNGQLWHSEISLSLEPDRFAGVTSYEEALARWEGEKPVRVLFDNGTGTADPGTPGPGFEASFDAWPIPELQPTAWYFAPGGSLTTTAPQESGADSYRYDPSRSQDTSLHGSSDEVWRAHPAWDWQPLPDGEAVAYATAPLDADVVLAGSASVDLWLSSTATDTDLQVTLSEIRPDGNETYIQNGWLRASHRKIDDAVSTELRPVQTHLEVDAAPLPAGEPVLARVELFPFAHAFRAGSRIRISIEAPGGDRVLWKFRALDAAGNVVNTISYGGATPSRIVLPVVPGIDVPTPLPVCNALRAQPCRAYVELGSQG